MTLKAYRVAMEPGDRHHPQLDASLEANYTELGSGTQHTNALRVHSFASFAHHSSERPNARDGKVGARKGPGWKPRLRRWGHGLHSLHPAHLPSADLNGQPRAERLLCAPERLKGFLPDCLCFSIFFFRSSLWMFFRHFSNKSN